ncbi:sodium:solute symporter [Aliifodinibius sp. S!AR15-10]|uniref:sodium:solute symporter n=1 Tax=Aliifodinibius sp. S!AR15-10 TaxID=2950437 RepID=UPI00285D66BB|nr:sodium:solute symporter [Aliifodinibius sp. S!AR15-10]MDR8393808.1 sodium:solute symporter [Aliifodinibius sp. S!AR15-10]
MSNIAVIDLIVIFTYLIAIVGLGLWIVRKKKMNAEGYFLAGHTLRWPAIGAALFASNISTIHLVGLAASGYNDGLVWGNYEWMAAFVLILLALVFSPFYFKNEIATLPEFLEKRYGHFARMCLAVLGILGALFIHIGVSLYAGAVVFENLFGINIYVSILLISVVTALYTVIGGLQSVVITETIQTVILIFGSIVLTVLGIWALPEHGITSWNGLVKAAKPEQLSIIPTDANSSRLTWQAILLGYPILGIWYWCADQTIVQRVLGAKTMHDAKIGPLFAGFLKILPVFIMVLPGVLGYVLFNGQITDADDTLLVLITELMPPGMVGLMSAALLAALMSTIAAALNSAGTLVSIDIYKSVKPGVSDKKQVFVGRITAVVVMIVAILWSPIIAQFDSIFEAINVLLTVISPPITAVFVWGVFWKRGNNPAAVATFVGGFILGVTAFLIDFPIVGDTKLLTEGLGISFMMQAWWLFVACSVIYVLTSLVTPEPDYDKIEDYTLSSPLAFLTSRVEEGGTRPLQFSLLLIVIMILLYITFR